MRSKGSKAGRSKGSKAGLAGLAVALSGVLGGCMGLDPIGSAPVSIAESSTLGGLPDDALTTPAPAPDESVEHAILSESGVGWLDEGARFAITLAGSSSCYSVPTAISAPTPQTIELTAESTGGPDCTADMVPRTHVIRTPDGVDPTAGVDVTIAGSTPVLVLPPLGR